MLVEIDETFYSESEINMSISICINLIGILERQILVQFSTTDSYVDTNADLALADMDYASVSINISFVDNTTTCISVQLLNDSILENEEVFKAVLTSTDPAVNITTSTAEILILDSNCELSNKAKAQL